MPHQMTVQLSFHRSGHNKSEVLVSIIDIIQQQHIMFFLLVSTYLLTIALFSFLYFSFPIYLICFVLYSYISYLSTMFYSFYLFLYNFNVVNYFFHVFIKEFYSLLPLILTAVLTAYSPDLYLDILYPQVSPNRMDQKNFSYASLYAF